MGYFSNGTEGRAYENRWCDRCVHRDGSDGDSGCSIWLLHLISNKEDSFLHTLIPRTAGGGNGRCTMFHEGAAAENTTGLTEADAEYLRCRKLGEASQ